MAKKTINVGLIGYKFMGKAHSNAYRQVARFFDVKLEPVMKVICGRDRAGVRAAARQFGWESYETSWEEVVARDDIELVDVSTSNDMHAPIAMAAAKAGKHILCEKPLALNLREAKQMLAAVQKARVKAMVCHNYRTIPAVALAKQMIEEGTLGEIYHWRAAYLQDWIMDPKFPLVWRLDKKVAGSGAHGDLNAHIIDLSRMLVGEIDEVVGSMETFIKYRPLLGKTAGGLRAKRRKKMGRVTVDDAALFLARFKNGALGTFEATRFAGGRKNHGRFEINGSKGSLNFCLERMNELEFYSREDPEGGQGFRTILTTDPSHPYLEAWWPPGHNIGYEHTFTHTIYNLLTAIAENKTPSPSFLDGVRNQAVLEAVEESAKKRAWVKVRQ